LGLLLRRVEHSAVLAYAQAHRDGFPDERVRAEEALGQLQSDAARSEPSAWDALDGAHRGEAVDAFHQLRALPAAGDAGRSADPERVALEPDASFQPALPHVRLDSAEQDAAVEPYKPDEAQSAEQSCAAQVFAALQPVARLDEAYSEPPEQQAMWKRSSMARQEQAAELLLVAALPDEPVVRRLPGPLVALAAQQELVASQPRAAQPVAQLEWVPAERKPELAGLEAAREQQVSAPAPRPLASEEQLAARDAPAVAPRPLPSSA
jgi:hypothetical protein